MTQKEFVRISCNHIRERRKKNFPDIRLSEEAMARGEDEKKAMKLWRKNRSHFAAMPPEVYRAALRESKTACAGTRL